MRQAIFTFATLALVSLALHGQSAPNEISGGCVLGGTIVDGSGNPAYVADIHIQGDLIVAIGAPPQAHQCRRRINAKGKTVTPGFIDIHSHADSHILSRPGAESYLRQGVTTFVGGQDGGSPLPLRPYLTKVASSGTAVNVGMLLGQGSVRKAVIGLENRRATPSEIREMKELVRQAMLDGAFGISTGLFYIPGAYTLSEEIIELAKVVAQYGGYHCSHMRDEADGILDSVRECIRIGEEGGLPTQLTHHKIVGRENWGKSVQTLALVDAARRRGVDVTIDQYPYTASSTGTKALFPQWAQEGGHQGLLTRLADPAQRAKIKTDVVRRLDFDRGGGHPKNVQLVACGFDERLAGKNLAQVTAERDREVTLETAAETMIEIEQAGGCSAVFHAMAEDDVRRIMKHPFTMIASDGGIPAFDVGAPHPRNYGTFSRVLGRYSRDLQVVPLTEAVRKMSSLPAHRLGLVDRGLLKVGMKADVVVLRAADVIDTAEFLAPHSYPPGVEYVLVNGELVVEAGRLTGRRPGRVLRGAGASR